MSNIRRKYVAHMTSYVNRIIEGLGEDGELYYTINRMERNVTANTLHLHVRLIINY